MKLSTLNSKMKIFSIGTNAKTAKGDKEGDAYTAILYLSPANTSGYEVCPNSGSCRQLCLGLYAGRSRFSNVQQARIRKTKMYFEDKPQFLKLVREDLEVFRKFCLEHNSQGYVRFNGSSDIAIESDGFIEDFPELQFYDYTKRTDRPFLNLPKNYHLTYSRDERTTKADIKNMIDVVNIAVVFDELPEEYEGIPVIDGDKDDLRPRDRSGVIVGLKAKGSNAKNDRTGFVVRSKA